MARIIIFGLDDLITYQISKTLTEESDATIIAVTPSKESEDYECDKSFIIDFQKNKDFEDLIKENPPDVIINTMIINDDEDSIASKNEIYFNYLKTLIGFAKENDAMFVHFSTSRVFSGRKGSYSEEDITDAEDESGIDMIAAERLISKSLSKYVIVRFSEVFGGNDGYNDFMNSYLTDLDNKVEGKINNITFNPLYVNDLANFLYFVIEKKKTGIYHIGSNDKTTLSSLLIKASQIMEVEGDSIDFEDSERDYSLNIYKSESEQIYKFSNTDSYLITMKHFANMSNKFYNTRK